MPAIKPKSKITGIIARRIIDEKVMRPERRWCNPIEANTAAENPVNTKILVAVAAENNGKRVTKRLTGLGKAKTSEAIRIIQKKRLNRLRETRVSIANTVTAAPRYPAWLV